MLTIDGLTVARGGVPLLERVGLRLEPGRIVALTGPSGCGKTSLLRAIAGLDDAAAGRVLLDGSAPHEMGWPAFRRAVGLVSQTPVLLPGSLRTSLERPFRYASATSEFPVERARRLAERLGLGASALEQEARTLSVGEQQRAALVRALLVAPRALLLDEPTSALDAANVSLVEDLVRREATDGGIGVLVVTHDAGQARRWCDETLDLAAFTRERGGARA